MRHNAYDTPSGRNVEMTQHFEELWEQCEKFHQENGALNEQISMQELIMKANFYESMMEKELPQDVKNSMKSRLLGEIIFILTKISLKEDIDTFAALQETLQYKSMEKVFKK